MLACLRVHVFTARLRETVDHLSVSRQVKDVPTTPTGNCTEIGTRNRYADALWFAGQFAQMLLSAGTIK